MLDVEYLPPVRATNSGLENTKKPDYQSGFFVPVVRLFFRFFPSFGGFSFSFFVKSKAASRVGQQINAVIGVSINPFFQ
ncbi:hypothetical protein EK639_003823 [Escherichia coli]|nr:hypothetical protein [Escherichia coli]